VRITRCPRCRAEDISVDAHPTRLLQNGQTLPVFVCRNCFRPAELEFRIACETNGVDYQPMPIRTGLRLLRDFYLDRYAEWQDPNLLLEDEERDAATARIRKVLADVERRLDIGAVEERVDG
jgi:Fe-S cluster biosynthesis and repair protein YggX